MRHCRHCGLDKPDDDFYPSLPSKCKVCKLGQQTAWRAGQAERLAEYWRKYRMRNPERISLIQKRHYRGNRDRWNRKQSLRAARKRGSEAERYDRWLIFLRDKFVCQLCLRRINMKLKFPHPLSPSIDHRIPLWAGGPDVAANVRAAHLICNLRKGKRVSEAATEDAVESALRVRSRRD